MKRKISTAMALAILTQSVAYTSNVFAQELKTTKLTAEQSVFSQIQKSIKSYSKVMDATGDGHAAINALVNGLSEGDRITAADLQRYMAVKAGENSQAYKTFESAIEISVKELKESKQELSAKELGGAVAQVMESVGSKGLQWSGCAGLTAGVIIALAAVTVGIIALVKNRSEQSVEKKYNQKIRDRDSRYVTDVNNANARPATIDREILKAQTDIVQVNNDIDDMQADIAYYNGVVSASLKNDDLEGAKAANAQIDALNIQIADARANIDHIEGLIARLQLEKTQYLDPAFLAQKLKNLELDYKSDIVNLEAEKTDKIELVPLHKKQAKTLGIAAGVGAAVGAYLIIDGAQDC